VNVLFGPNGAGKSSFLDTIWFVRDCAVRGVDIASSTRSHGIGILWDGASEQDPVAIALATDKVDYELTIGLSSGRIEPFVGERLQLIGSDIDLIHRVVGTDRASFHHAKMDQAITVSLREPEKLSLARYLDFEQEFEEAVQLDRLLHYVHWYHSRSFNLIQIKQRGSEASHETWLWSRGENIWSVLRNLQAKQSLDNRYRTIMEIMSKTFPSFDGLVLEQTGPTSVYASFLEKGRRKPIHASGASDGHVQMLLLLTSLFSEGWNRTSLMLFDEPEISLHPWALTMLAEAVKLAADQWNKQILIATHSPVLISQFDPKQILAAEVDEGRTRICRVSDIDGVRDLLEQYATGSLYMSEMIAAQSKPNNHEEQDG
jgi:predicted ATPase